MKNRNTRWGVLIAVIALLLAGWVLPPLPGPKVQSSRITGINNISGFSITSTNALSRAAPSK